MPCPFAPLLSIIPALPFIPWIIGKSLERLGKKGKDKLVVENVECSSNSYVKLENDQAFSLDNLNLNLQEIEFYRFGAPHFRKSKAQKIILASDQRSEFLIFATMTELVEHQKLMEIFMKYPILRAIAKKNRWLFKIVKPEDFSPQQLEVLIQDLDRELEQLVESPTKVVL